MSKITNIIDQVASLEPRTRVELIYKLLRAAQHDADKLSYGGKVDNGMYITLVKEYSDADKPIAPAPPADKGASVTVGKKVNE